jgi:sigma-B regulation protein RsbU (phosphoserine phosphatase)
MFKNIREKLKVLWPFLLAGFILLIIIVLVVPEFSWYHLLLFIATVSLGFLIGNMNTPGVRFRQRKVRKQQKDLRNLNAQMKILTAAIESAANGIIITDTKGVIQWVNPAFCRLTGFSIEESVGSTFNIISSGKHDKAFFEDMWHTISSGKVWHNEIINRRKNGELYTEEMTITPVKDRKGNISSFVAIKQDISERKRLEEISAREKKSMETELDVAREIQMDMLIDKFPPFPEKTDLDIYARLIPARQVGGDFYDFFWIDEERFCFLVGDVSGKGVPAALMMAVTKTLLKSGINQESSPAKTLTFVNNEISRENEKNMFITVFVGILNTTTGYLTYSNAGHTPSYILGGNGGETVILKELHGVVIGAVEGLKYKESVVRINRGDTVFVYTDGITEARDIDNKLFSDERLHNLLVTNKFTNSEELIDLVFKDVLNHEKGADSADDITALSIHYNEQREDTILDNLFTSIYNKIDNIRPFLEEFESFAEKHKVDQEAVQQLNIVFDELLSNTIKYAYRDEDNHEIEIKVRYYKDKLTITILDDGIPYNPFDQMEPDTSLSIEDRDIGGLGVHLVKFLVDDYSYEYKEQIKKNHTHFIKLLNQNR